MKRFVASLLATIGLGSSAAPKDAKPTVNVMQEMRARALALKAEEIGVNRQNFTEEVWGVLMETGLLAGGAYTLLVLADGTTSLYFSNGGGIIGAGEHQSVRSAGKVLLVGANGSRGSAKLTTNFPLPSSGQVIFYFLSYSGVLTYSAQERALGEGKDRLSALFHAAHNVITEARKIEEARRR